MFNTNENRVGAFAGLVAFVLVLALTAMAFTALSPPRQADASDWNVSLPEPSSVVSPSFSALTN